MSFSETQTLFTFLIREVEERTIQHIKDSTDSFIPYIKKENNCKLQHIKQ
ncbi:MAG TPA: hypothetical protein VN703_09190 [Candidatus Sulfopaludibacter sp.]|nr:hypothetical protein [Candidatus Sulfopaludibacter sp.]